MNRETRIFIFGFIQMSFFAWASLIKYRMILSGDYDWIDAVLCLVYIYLMHAGMKKVRSTL